MAAPAMLVSSFFVRVSTLRRLHSRDGRAQMGKITSAVRSPILGKVSLAESPKCAVNAMALGPVAFGLQYHVELTSTTVREWAEIPAYAGAVKKLWERGPSIALMGNAQP